MAERERQKAADPFFQDAAGVEARVVAFYNKLGANQVDYIRRDLQAFGYGNIFDLNKISGFVAAVKDFQNHNLHVKDDGMWGFNTQRAFDEFTGPNYLMAKSRGSEAQFIADNFKKVVRQEPLKKDQNAEAAEKALQNFFARLPTDSNEQLSLPIRAPTRQDFSDPYKTAKAMGYEYQLNLEIPGKKERLVITVASIEPIKTTGELVAFATDLIKESGTKVDGHISSMAIVSGNRAIAEYSQYTQDFDREFANFAQQFYALTGTKKGKA